MKASNSIKTVLALFSFCLSLIALPTLVQAEVDSSGKDYQEVSYDDLLNELNAKKTNIRKDTQSSLDTVMIHAGLGYVNSFSNFRTNGQNESRYQNGLQLSLGIDLFSPNWYSEGVFRNYGVTSQGSEDINLKEFDLKVGYKAPISNIWAYSFGTGIANRFLKITDSSRDVSVNETTPSFMLSGGFYATPSKNISVGLEANARTPFVSDTADQNSFDFALKVITSL